MDRNLKLVPQRFDNAAIPQPFFVPLLNNEVKKKEKYKHNRRTIEERENPKIREREETEKKQRRNRDETEKKQRRNIK